MSNPGIPPLEQNPYAGQGTVPVPPQPYAAAPPPPQPYTIYAIMVTGPLPQNMLFTDMYGTVIPPVIGQLYPPVGVVVYDFNRYPIVSIPPPQQEKPSAVDQLNNAAISFDRNVIDPISRDVNRAIEGIQNDINKLFK